MKYFIIFIIIFVIQLANVNGVKRIATATDEERGSAVTVTEPRKIQDNFRRFIGPDGIVGFVNGTEVDNDKAKEYAINVGAYAAVPIVFAIFSLLCCICCLYCRCLCGCCKCCGKCCGCCKKKDHKTYTKCERYWPLIILIGLAFLSISWASTGIAENSRFSDTLSGKNDDSLTIFAPKLINDTEDKLDIIQDKITSVNDLIANTVIYAQNLVDETRTTFVSGTDNLRNALTLRGSQIGGLVVTPDCAKCLGHDYESGYGSTLSGVFDSVIAELNNAVDPEIKKFEDVLNELDDLIIQKKTEITDKLKEIDDQFVDIDKNLIDARDNVNDATDQVKKYDDLRNGFMYGLFALCYISGILIGIGILLKFSVCFKANMWLNFLIAFIMWFLMAVHAPLAILIADSCIYADREELNELEKANDVANVGNACLKNSSLIKAFGAESQLNFTNEIDFSFVDEVDFNSLFNITLLNTQYQTALGLTISDFNISTTLLNNEISCLNGIIADGVDRFNITSYTFPTPLSQYDSCCTAGGGQCITIIVGRAADYQVLDTVTSEIITNITSVENVKNDLRDSLITQQQKVKNSSVLIDPFIQVGEDLKAQATCGFLGNSYKSFKGFLCDKLAKHISILALCLFMCASIAWLNICCSMCNHSRWSWGKGKVASEDDDELEEADQEYVDEVYSAPASGRKSAQSTGRKSFRKDSTDSIELTSNAPPSYEGATNLSSSNLKGEEGNSSRRRGRSNIKFVKKY